MKNEKQSISRKILVSTILTGFLLSSGVGVGFAQSENITINNVNNYEQSTKYNKKVMENVRISLGVDKHSTQLDININNMTKLQVMDIYLDSFGKKIKGPEVRKAVYGVFNIDLDMISKMNYGSKLDSYSKPVMEKLRLSLNISSNSNKLDNKIMDMKKSEVMDRYIKESGYNLTYNELRTLINDVFGVNLTGISGLENGQLSIYSKGVWVIQNDNDLFKISSSLDDVSIYVEGTDYFEKLTGSRKLPDSLIDKLLSFGFTYDEVAGNYFYTNSSGESVPDADKTKTIGAIMQTIQELNTVK